MVVPMIAWCGISLEEKIERWEHVDIVLSKLTPHEKRYHFDMSVFGEKSKCGTVACAAGYAGLNRWFRNRGFRLNFIKVEYPNFDGGVYYEWRMALPTGDRESIGQEVIRFFGKEASENIFFNDNLRSVAQVRKEIKEYIKELQECGIG